MTAWEARISDDPMGATSTSDAIDNRSINVRDAHQLNGLQGLRNMFQALQGWQIDGLPIPTEGPPEFIKELISIYGILGLQ
jgi:hypothetical protein